MTSRHGDQHRAAATQRGGIGLRYGRDDREGSCQKPRASAILAAATVPTTLMGDAGFSSRDAEDNLEPICTALTGPELPRATTPRQPRRLKHEEERSRVRRDCRWLQPRTNRLGVGARPAAFALPAKRPSAGCAAAPTGSDHRSTAAKPGAMGLAAAGPVDSHARAPRPLAPLTALTVACPLGAAPHHHRPAPCHPMRLDYRQPCPQRLRRPRRLPLRTRPRPRASPLRAASSAACAPASNERAA